MQSLFLDSLSGQQAQAAEVALAQAAAREAVGERGELEHMLTWLTGAHAEEAAMHRTFKAEVRPYQRCHQHPQHAQFQAHHMASNSAAVHRTSLQHYITQLTKEKQTITFEKACLASRQQVRCKSGPSDRLVQSITDVAVQVQLVNVRHHKIVPTKC